MSIFQDENRGQGERVVRKGGKIKFQKQIWQHDALLDKIDQPVWICPYGWYDIDVYPVIWDGKKWGCGFGKICRIESKEKSC